jgi:hypothetical protein
MASAIAVGAQCHPQMNKDQQAFAKQATGKTKLYEKARWRHWKRLVKTMQDDPYLGPLTEIDENTDPNDDSPREMFFTELRGAKTEDKKVILNQAMQNVVALWKKSNGEEYEPGTWVTTTNSLFGFFNEYGIEFKVADFEYRGGWTTTMLAKINDVARGDVTRTYGAKGTKGVLDPNFHQKIYDAPQLNCFANAEFFHHILLYKLGVSYLLRGSSEHRNLTFSMFETGVLTASEIPVDDYEECKGYIGRKWLRLKYLFFRKNQKLTRSMPWFEVEANNNRIFADDSDKYCTVRIFEAHSALCHPDQIFVYCHIATPRQKAAYKVKYGRDILFDLKKPIGTNTLGTYLKVLGGIAGFDNWTTVHNHLLRVRGITDLVNDKSVPNQLALSVAQHRSNGSQKPYARSSLSTQIAASLALRAHPAVTHLEIDEVVQEAVSRKPAPWGWGSISTCNITKGVSCIIS